MKHGNLVLLRLLLLVVAAAGLFSSVALFIPWATTVAILKQIGIGGVPAAFSSPIIEYWMFTSAAVSGVVGYLYLVAALKPEKFWPIVPILGWGLIFIGVAVGYHGFRLGLPLWPLGGDLGICAVCGPGIIWLSKSCSHFSAQ